MIGYVRAVFWMIFSVCVAAVDISFQAYLVDDQYQPISQAEATILVRLSSTNGWESLDSTQTVTIQSGVLSSVLTVDGVNASVVFDQPNMRLVITFVDLYDDPEQLVIPIQPSGMAIVSDLADRANQIDDTTIVYVDELNRRVSIGQSQEMAALAVSGTVLADRLIGSGRGLRDVVGTGWNDGHSLERSGSRATANYYATSSDQRGVDAVFVSNDPYVGLLTTQPKMPMDARGTVLFLTDSLEGTGLQYPLNTNTSVMAWDSANGSFRAGNVSQNSWQQKRGSVALGDASMVSGLFSGTYGGRQHRVQGAYSASISGENHAVYGDYGLSIGGHGHLIKRSDSIVIGGQENAVTGYRSVVIQGRNNQVSASDAFVIGNENSVAGSRHVVIGDTNNVQAEGSVLLASNTSVTHPYVHVFSTLDTPLSTTMSNTILFRSANGLSVNTTNAIETVTIDRAIQATYFYGDGSRLTNTTTTDPYWQMTADAITQPVYRVGIGTSNISNALTLNHGLVVGAAAVNEPGTLMYKDDAFYGITQSGVQRLATDGYSFAYVGTGGVHLEGNELSLETANIGDKWVFNGNEFEPHPKDTWQWVLPNRMFYDAPISIGKPKFFGQLTIMHDSSRVLVQHQATRGGVGLSESSIGLNMMNQQLLEGQSVGYGIAFDSVNGGFQVSSQSGPLLRINPNGRGYFWSGDDTDVVWQIPTKAVLGHMAIDSVTDSDSTIAHKDRPSQPVLHRYSTGDLHIQSKQNTPVVFQLSNGTHLNSLAMTVSSSSVILGDIHPIIPGIHIQTGDLTLDTSDDDALYAMGTFSTPGFLEQGISFGTDQVLFYASNLPQFGMASTGIGIRVPRPEASVHVWDTTSATVKLNATVMDPVIRFDAEDAYWQFRSDSSGRNILAGTETDSATAVHMVNQTLGIGMVPNGPDAIQIDGDVGIQSDVVFIESSGMPQAKIAHDTNGIRMVSSGNIRIESKDMAAVIVTNNRVMINGLSSVTDAALVIQTPAVVSALQYAHLPIWSKTIRAMDHAIPSINELATLTLDSGFHVSSVNSHAVIVGMNPHFSSMETIPESDDLNELGTVNLHGYGVSIHLTEGVSDDTVSFEYNALDGVIDGDLTVQTTLNASTISGNALNMHHIPFPWEHIATKNGQAVAIDYIISSNVGIQTEHPSHALTVSGDVRIRGDAIIPSIQHHGSRIVASNDAWIMSEKSIVLHVEGQTETARMGPVLMQPNAVGIQGIHPMYRLTVSSNAHTSLGLMGNAPRIAFAHNTSRFAKIVALNDGVSIGTDASIPVGFQVGSHNGIYVDNSGVGIGVTQPYAAVHVSGNVMIGNNRPSGLNHVRHAVVVQDRVGINTVDPQTSMDVFGSMGIGGSPKTLDSGNMLLHDGHSLVVGYPIDAYNAALRVSGNVYVTNGVQFGSGSTPYFGIQLDADGVQLGAIDSSSRTFGLSATEAIVLGATMRIDDQSVTIGSTQPGSGDFNLFGASVNVMLESTGTTDQQSSLYFKSGIGVAQIGFDQYIANYMVIMGDPSLLDSQNGGATLQMDVSGNIDIGFNVNVNDQGSPPAPHPTHPVALDVDGSIQATAFTINGDQLTSMPIGSIIMWSGWHDDLPDGWKFCTGNNDDNGTTACNLTNQFIIGAATMSAIETQMGSLAVSVSGMAHSHAHPSHSHSVPNNTHTHSTTIQQGFNTGYTTNARAATNVGDQYYEEHYTNPFDAWRKKTSPIIQDIALSHQPDSGSRHRHTADHPHSRELSSSTHGHVASSVEPAAHDPVGHAHQFSQVMPPYYTLAFIYLEGLSQ